MRLPHETLRGTLLAGLVLTAVLYLCAQVLLKGAGA
jgi:hypothetical protein